MKYKWFIINNNNSGKNHKGWIRFPFKDNSFWSILWRDDVDTLTGLMRKAFAKIYGVSFHRSIGGLSAELIVHYLAYKLKYNLDSSKEADMGPVYSYKGRPDISFIDSNAKFLKD